jgi:transcriptional regulator with XRE-family HTH domain
MIPKRLFELRSQAEISQEKLGIAAGIDQYTAKNRVSKYEAGINEPKYGLICEFAKVLGVPPCYFYIAEDDFAEAVLRLWQQKETPVLENSDNLALRKTQKLTKKINANMQIITSKINELTEEIIDITSVLEKKTRRKAD